MIKKRKSYLDRKLIVLHGGVNEEHKGLGEKAFVFGVTNESLIVLEQLNCVVVDCSARVVEPNQAFFGVDLALKFEHLLRVVLIDHQNFATSLLFAFLNLERHREASLYVHF